MNKDIQEKIELYKKMAKSQRVSIDSMPNSPGRPDSLSQVIRSKKDADDFMAELNAIIKRS
jgi:hypothetical protein